MFNGAVIFDFDGVITDSEILHWRSFNEVLKNYGIEILKADYYKTYLGLTDVDCYKLLIEQGRLDTKGHSLDDLVNQKMVFFRKLAQSEGNVIEGVRDFLKMLSDNNVTMAICSGALRPEIELLLEDSKLRHYFKVIVSAEEVSKGKPDPQGFNKTLQRLNEACEAQFKPSQCIVIEDSHWGVKAAKNAGMKVIAVTNTYDADVLQDADVIIENLSDLSIARLTNLIKRDYGVTS